ncbi:MAG: thermonuclease family protein [Verrucomicrobiales bacterium]|nr:thermonuclease family protein [Verrucomicrobiales bacterium]
MPKSSKSITWIILIVAISLIKVWYQRQNLQNHTSSRPPSTTARGEWQAITGARLLENSGNDGDSFHLDLPGHGDREVRLYFVDAPEKRRHQYNGDRLRHQGAYFGGLSEARTTAIGQQAKDFTATELRRQPFTVHTRWQSVFGSERVFAFIQFADGDYLSEKLTRAGLSRIYTEGAPLPDGRRTFDFEQHLKKLEAEAKTRHLGGWSGR